MRVFAYLKALLPVFLMILGIVGGIVAFFFLVQTVPHTPLPLLGLGMILGGFVIAVADGGKFFAEVNLVYLKYSNPDKVSKRARIRELKRDRKSLLRDLSSMPSSRDHIYKMICKKEIEIAEAKGKSYRYPKYQPGSPKDW